MTSDPRRLLQWLSDSMRRNERAHGFYSRAFGVLIWVAVLAMLIVSFVMAQQSPYASAACRAQPDAAHDKVLATDIELAQSPHELRSHLAGKLKLTRAGPEPAAICVAERADRYARLLTLDATLFIPAYLLLAAFSLCWLLAMSVHTAKDAEGQWATPRRGLMVWLGLSALAVLGTSWLDSAENRAALQVLERASGIGALVEPMSAELLAAMSAAYQASLYKWLATAAWAATLAAPFWHQRATLAAACGSKSSWRGLIGRVLIHAFIGLALVATLALLIGSVGGLSMNDAPARWIPGLILAGFIAVSLCGLVLALLEAVRIKARPRASTGG